jgi:hypothetical protein
MHCEVPNTQQIETTNKSVSPDIGEQIVTQTDKTNKSDNICETIIPKKTTDTETIDTETIDTETIDIENKEANLEPQKNNDINELTETTEGLTETTEKLTKTTEKLTKIPDNTKPDTKQEDANSVGEQSQIYQYCPTNVNGAILYCSNENNKGEVKDGIYLNGTQVLATTSGAWDSAQVCDPSVISGNFAFNGSSYTYLMAYLGCATNDCTNNEIGFAVSNDLYNWTKVGKIVSCVNDGFWGVGQPALMNLKNDGMVYLFYTSGTAAKTTTYAQYLDCRDLNNIQNLGQVEITTPYDFISNADFGYADGYLYMTCDTHPFSEGVLNFISDKQTVYKAAWSSSFKELPVLSWQIETVIDASQTGYAKNHNACFAKDGYGNLIGRTICVTIASEVGDFLDNLFTYRIIPVNF